MEEPEGAALCGEPQVYRNRAQLTWEDGVMVVMAHGQQSPAGARTQGRVALPLLGEGGPLGPGLPGVGCGAVPAAQDGQGAQAMSAGPGRWALGGGYLPAQPEGSLGLPTEGSCLPPGHRTFWKAFSRVGQ